jgi:hypothetical protein
MWIVIIGVLIVFGIFAIANEKNEANEVERQKHVFKEVKEHVNKRVTAYADYLRRTSTNEIRLMSNNELNDLIERAMEGYEKDVAKSKWPSNIAFGIAIVAFVALIAGDESAKPFIIVTVIAGSFLRSWSKARVDKKYISNGWDPIRLKLD